LERGEGERKVDLNEKHEKKKRTAPPFMTNVLRKGESTNLFPRKGKKRRLVVKIFKKKKNARSITVQKGKEKKEEAPSPERKGKKEKKKRYDPGAFSEMKGKRGKRFGTEMPMHFYIATI